MRANMSDVLQSKAVRSGLGRNTKRSTNFSHNASYVISLVCMTTYIYLIDLFPSTWRAIYLVKPKHLQLAQLLFLSRA